MGNTYDEYCAYMRSRGWEPVIEEVWRREYAPKPVYQPMIITPRNARKQMAPTMANHSVLEEVSEKKTTAAQPKAVKPPKKRIMSPEAREERNRRKREKNAAVREAKGMAPLVRARRSEMSEEEWRAHRKRLKAEQDARRREKIAADPARLENHRKKQRVYSRESKRRMREDQERYAKELERNREWRSQKSTSRSTSNGCAA